MEVWQSSVGEKERLSVCMHEVAHGRQQPSQKTDICLPPMPTLCCQGQPRPPLRVVESVVERVGQRLGYVMLISLVGVGRHQSHCERGERGKVVHGINLKGFFIVTSALSSLFAPPTEIVAQSRNVPLIDVGKL